MKKLFLITAVIFSLGLGGLAAQEDTDANQASVPAEENPSKKSFFSSIDFLLQFTPAVYINPESTLVSAPSPIIYPLGIGFLFPKAARFAIQPTLSFFMMYHLWYDGKALPAEIENRTSQTISFLLDIPAVFQIFASEKSRFQVQAGAALLMRFGILAGGVKESDSGYTGSAGSDMDEINSWFWQNARFLYFSLGGSWLYTFTDHLKAGPTMNIYLPAGSFASGEGAQALIISIGLKLCL